MKKRKSIRETKNMLQTALWLPRDMHEQLKSSESQDYSDEIRRRLQYALAVAETPSDEITTKYSIKSKISPRSSGLVR